MAHYWLERHAGHQLFGARDRRLTRIGSAAGSGVLFWPRLLMTNNHVLRSIDEALAAEAQFDYAVRLSGERVRRPAYSSLSMRITEATLHMSSLTYLLDDHPRTLFPLSSTAILAQHCGSSLLTYVSSHVLDKTKPNHSFLPQTRVFASKHGLNLRRTVKLDPVAELFFYDLVHRNRKQFPKDVRTNRKSFGYGFANGKPIPPSTGFAGFRTAIATARKRYRYSAKFDVATYFNSIYQHDLVDWASNAGWQASDVAAWGQFLREINAGRSVDCLPHGIHPAKLVGSDFLKFVDQSLKVESELLLRFMDDFYVFSDDLDRLQADFIAIQELLGERGLSLNAAKTQIGAVDEHDIPARIDSIKISLLKVRRQNIVDYEGEVETTMHEYARLKDEQVEYLASLLGNPEIDEADAELVLTLLREHGDEVIGRLSDFLTRFPGLSRNIYNCCRSAPDKNEVASLLLRFLQQAKHVTEYQLFWIGKLVEDDLRDAHLYPDLLRALLQHPHATAVSLAKVLEIPDQRFGMDDVRETYLKDGRSDWPTWAAVVGLRTKAPTSRNHLLSYYGKASHIAKLISEAVAGMPAAVTP